MMNDYQTWIDEIHNNSRYGIKGKILVKKKSNFQEIIILKTKNYGNALMLDGCWMTSDKDEKYYHELLVHPALSSKKNIEKILIIGGGDGGTARECLKYKGIKKIDLIEIDSDVIDLSKKYLKQIGGKVWSDARLNIHIMDGLKWVKKTSSNYYDAILIDCSDPSEFASGLFSLEFYKECSRIIKSKGIFATQSESPESFKKTHLKILNKLKKIFKHTSTAYSFVPFYPSGMWSWTFASNNNKKFLNSNYKDIKTIEESCEIWNQNFQSGALKMMPSKIMREISSNKL